MKRIFDRSFLFQSVLFALLSFAAFDLTAQNDPPKVVFSKEAGFYKDEVSVELSSNRKEARIFYTTDGTPPSRLSARYSAPIKVTQNTVIRAIAATAKESSEPAASTYFINENSTLPVFSIGVKPSLLFHPETGLFSKGPNAKENYPFYGANFWSRRELAVSVEFFEDNGKRELEQQAGLSVFGGMSRVWPQKSMVLAARKRYGEKYFKHPFFTDRPFKKYKHLVLRNSGSDFGNTHFRDDMITSLAADAGLEVQAYRPSLVFINGTYWGIYNMREKLNRYFVGNHYGVDRDSIDLIEHRQELKFGSIKHYNTLRSFLRLPETHLDDPKQFAYVSSLMDVDNFLTYEAIEIYIDNQDAGGNIKFWRPHRPDGKWSWILFDTDFGFGLYETDAYKNNSLESHTQPDGPAWPNPPWSTLNLRKMLENPGCRRTFINRFADLMNTVFQPDYVIARIDSFQRRLAPEMPRHLARWKRNEKKWQDNCERMRIFARERPQWMCTFLDQRFKTGKPVAVEIALEGNGTVIINDFVKKQAFFKGAYFEKVPIALNAKPAFGYRFVKWKGVVGSEEHNAMPRQEVLPGNGLRLTAVFEPTTSSLSGKVFLSEMAFHNPQCGDWVELYNASSLEVGVGGWQVVSEKKTYTLPEAQIAPKGFLVFCDDTLAFRKAFPDYRHALVLCKKFELNGAKGFLEIYNAQQAPIDSAVYRLEPNAKPFVLDLRHPKLKSQRDLLEGLGHPGQLSERELVRSAKARKKQRVLFLLIGFAVVLILASFYRFWKKPKDELTQP